jgi:hypothetical protein
VREAVFPDECRQQPQRLPLVVYLFKPQHGCSRYPLIMAAPLAHDGDEGHGRRLGPPQAVSNGAGYLLAVRARRLVGGGLIDPLP